MKRLETEMRITKVYTKSGDDGTTGLVGGARVSKSHLRVAAYGDVDELNAVIGLARAHAKVVRVQDTLKAIQNELFSVGAELATPVESKRADGQMVTEAMVAHLEALIDDFNGDLLPLVEFVLPGGSPGCAFLHQARTVCRRAERSVVALANEEAGADEVSLRYLNRLSDLLFVMARWVDRDLTHEEQWQR